MQHKDFSNKVVLITGGTSGMGYASARAFVVNGAKVVITGRRAEEGELAASELRRISSDVLFIPADVSKEDQVQAMMERIIKEFGKLDIAHNNAGIEGAWKPLDETSETDFDTLTNVNFKGTWLCCKHEILQFKKQKSAGVIVNTSSWLAKGVLSGSGIYSASKAALDSLTRSVAIENSQFNIRANNINPGYIDTPLSDRMLNDEMKDHIKKHVPMSRMGKSEEIAELVLWLASDASSYITGETILIDGGLAIPGQRF
jgi:NAD(P)-dependent dehydrogenase (short-subunit alcohol dehydrogenase family)